MRLEETTSICKSVGARTAGIFRSSCPRLIPSSTAFALPKPTKNASAEETSSIRTVPVKKSLFIILRPPDLPSMPAPMRGHGI